MKETDAYRWPMLGRCLTESSNIFGQVRNTSDICAEIQILFTRSTLRTVLLSCNLGWNRII